MKNKHKILYIVRHAKSSWDYDNIADVDRPLKVKGIKVAYEMARNIKLNNNLPELILSSPANRAIHTAMIFARVFELPTRLVQIDEGFYEASVSYSLEKIMSTDDSINILMVFGHNPDFTDLANQLLKEPLSDLPTTGTVKLEFSADSWSKIDPSTLVKHSCIFPAKENGAI
ncbi:MAG: histidine phosphatase family protein [Bacteroidales bacterium]|nr:histidine phosphatase family protein [Bacteroidales bacterium]